MIESESAPAAEAGAIRSAPLRASSVNCRINRPMSYNREQLEALRIVRRHLLSLSGSEMAQLREQIAEYRAFRHSLDAFLQEHFDRICTEACFRSRRSACCTREGIVVFFGDVVVNALESSPSRLAAMEEALAKEEPGFKCVFLSDSGCLWQVRPIVCAMFLCDPALGRVFENDPETAARWETFKARRKDFTWPDKPVLFDELEQRFIRAGLRSPLMHLNTSPGLLRIKKKAGLLSDP
jgi:hypothetical protein